MLSLSHLISAPANMSAAGAWQVTAACLFTRPAAGNDERRSPFEALHSDERRGAVVPTPSSSHADHLADGDDKSAMALDDAAPLGGMTAEEEELALFGTIVSAKPEAHDVKVCWTWFVCCFVLYHIRAYTLSVFQRSYAVFLFFFFFASLLWMVLTAPTRKTPMMMRTIRPSHTM